MSNYATIKGRTTKAAETHRRDPPALREAGAARVETNRQFVRKHLPELVPTIRALYDAGLIDGWRAVTKCKLLERNQ